MHLGGYMTEPACAIIHEHIVAAIADLESWSNP